VVLFLIWLRVYGFYCHGIVTVYQELALWFTVATLVDHLLRLLVDETIFYWFMVYHIGNAGLS